MKKNCITCGKEYDSFGYSLYCSSQCKTQKDKNKKTCPICEKVFYDSRSYRICCSISCASRKKWLNESFRENQVNKQKEALTNFWTDNDDAKQKHSKILKEFHKNHPEYGESMSKFQKDFQNRPDVKINNSRKSAERNNQDNVKDAFVKRIKTLWNDPAWSASTKEAQKKAQNREDLVEKNRQRGLDQWKDIDYVNRVLSNSFKRKSFILPSGKEVQLQGHEPNVLERLLEKHSEEDILIGVKNINDKIGLIKYEFNGKFHTYYPDFYIISTNTIVEVKSDWTYEKWKEKNIAKKKACLEKGFNFIFAFRNKNYE